MLRDDGGWFTLFDPDLDPRSHPALWAPDAPCVLSMRLVSSVQRRPVSAPLTQITSDGILHQVFADHHGRHRLSLFRSASHPGIILPVDGMVDVRLKLARRYVSYLRCGSGGDGSPVWPSERQRRRLVMLLRVTDARTAGLSSREILRHLGGTGAAESRAIEWKSTAGRRRVYRLIADARAFVTQDYRRLLGVVDKGQPQEC